jgi:hypothetical protein
MRKKLALASLLAVVAISLAAAQTAFASYIFVRGELRGVTGLCRPTPDQLSYRLQFRAKVTASGVKKPSKVRVGWQVVDADTKNNIKSGVLNLKKSKGYKGETRRITVTQNEYLIYHVNLKYTVNGRTKKAKADFSDHVPTTADMDAAGVPAC